MKSSRREIIKEILSIRFNIYNYKKLYKKASRRGWLGLLSISLVGIYLSVMILLNKVEIGWIGIRGYEIIIIAFCLFMILLSYKMMRLKIEKPRLDNLITISDEELEKILTNTKLEEENFKKMVATRIASDFAVFSVMLIVIAFALIWKLIENEFDILRSLESYTKQEYNITFFSLFTFFLILGNLIGAPVSPRKYEKITSEIKSRVRNIILVNISLSKLNPGIGNETN